ncbi:DUF300 family protein [Schizosaccharomyces japonicus yFS275]|uniref:DUF300 family protein n=1 Tax=Schizosaccharomyces japonicus (strain yFS275 / FY16936) TaxID=402676 RepID=B6K2S7_SCHJY|nr:DUF300 family protein [Schizosaccharomyces japonicus yFS275]EEB08567.1 DUF300 family protein [Schizosaccharomyces japonicus yFS275]
MHLSLRFICFLFAGFASAVSFLAIWNHLKNYRKPLLQRSVCRILFMVPLYSFSCAFELYYPRAGKWVEFLREMYEAFVLYCFFCLLIDYLGGERATVLMLHGQPSRPHPWPMTHILGEIDLSDPKTFLNLKRGILQYTLMKPILVLVQIVSELSPQGDEGSSSLLLSPAIWIVIIYNVSITISLYSLTTFWYVLHSELEPFRPVPKFLSVKAIIFASYWQMTILSVLQWAHAFPADSEETANRIQDILMCLEMPFFALLHRHAFRWEDYKVPGEVSCGRLPLKRALVDCLGLVDVWCDIIQTTTGERYDYREFEPGANIIPYAPSARAVRTRHGLRYVQGGQSKYWVPTFDQSRARLIDNSNQTMNSYSTMAVSDDRINSNYEGGLFFDIDPEVENLYTLSREMTFGDYNYPVLTVHDTEDSPYSSIV